MPGGSGTGTPVTTTARAGMVNLIRRLRGMSQASTAMYTVDNTSWWTDEQVQEVLDLNRIELYNEYMTPMPEFIGGEYVYKDYGIGKGNLEEYGSTITTFFAVYDVNGNIVSSSSYTVDYINGVVRFTTDQNATSYFVRARSYLLHNAAAQMWTEMAGWVAERVNFKADDQGFDLSDWFDHCMRMAEKYEGLAGAKSSKFVRGDLS